MTDKEHVEFLTKCSNIPYKDYSWLKDHCYKTLKRPCSPNSRNEHLAILDLIREHEERQWTPVSERLPEEEIVKPYLVKIRAEIEQMPSELTADGRRMIRRESVFRIIDNCK